MTRTWTEVIVEGNGPTPRDGHTASALDSKLVLFGGRGNVSTGTALLGDEWEIDLDPTYSVSATSNASTVSSTFNNGSKYNSYRKISRALTVTGRTSRVIYFRN